MNLVTLVVEVHDEDMGSLPDIVGSPNVMAWCWGNAIDEATSLRGTMIDLLNAQRELMDVTNS